MKKKPQNRPPVQISGDGAPDCPPHRPALTLDHSQFMHFLEGAEWTDEQKKEFIESLWVVVVSFVDLGFDLHPIQQVLGDHKTLDGP